MKIKIEKNVPIEREARQKYPFEKMEIGDSFLAGEYNPNSSRAVYSSVYNYMGKNKGTKFIVRKDGQRIRVWRTK